MKLDLWQAISDLLDAGGKFDYGRYQIRNSKGHLHRDDGPAIIHQDGTQSWYRNGLPHRDDGPAAIYPDGTQQWYRNGKLHRDDGPAIIYPDGTKYWYLNDKIQSKK